MPPPNGPRRDGPFKRVPPPNLPADPGRVRVSHLYAEIIHSGGDNRVRVSHLYAEIIHAFGTPPPIGPGVGGNNKGGGKSSPPGQIKKQADVAFAGFLRAWRQNKRRLLQSNWQPDIFDEIAGSQPTRSRPLIRESTRAIEIDVGRHTVKRRH